MEAKKLWAHLFFHVLPVFFVQAVFSSSVVVAAFAGFVVGLIDWQQRLVPVSCRVW